MIKVNTLNIALLVLGLAPIAIMLYCIMAYGVNAPHWDDHAIRVFLDKYLSSDSFIENVKSIFAYHNEHRIGTTRLVAISIFKLKGFLDFKTMQLVGFTGLISIWMCLALLIRKLWINSLAFVVLGFALFNFALYENLLWGMASIQNFWVIALAIASFYLLAFKPEKEDWKAKIYFIFALSFSTLAVFTSGNGILIPLIGALMLILSREKVNAIIWMLVSLVVLIVYFIGFNSLPSKTISLNIQALKAFFAAVGSLAYFNNGSGIRNLTPLLGGLISVTVLAIIASKTLGVWKSAKNIRELGSSLFLFSTMAFLFGTLAIVSINRSHFEFDVILSIKYKIYSYLIFIITVIFLSSFIKGNWQGRFLSLMSILSLFFWINTYINYYDFYPKIEGENKAFVLNNYNTLQIDSTSYKAQKDLKALNLDFENAKSQPDLIDSIRYAEVTVDVWEFTQYQPNVDEFVIFKSDSSQYFVSMYPLPKGSKFKRMVGFYQDRMAGNLNLLNLKTGIYRLFYLKKSNSGYTLFNTEKTLRISGVPYTQDPKNW